MKKPIKKESSKIKIENEEAIQTPSSNFLTFNSITSSCKNINGGNTNWVLQSKKSEVTSNESTPRIEDENIEVNTLQENYCQGFQNSFYSKNKFR